jgi:hypothetical protein
LLLTLDQIDFFYSTDNKKVKLKDVYIDIKNQKIDQFVCQVGNLFPTNVLVSPLLIEHRYDLNSEVYFQLFSSKERLKDFRNQNEVQTYLEECRNGQRENINWLDSIKFTSTEKIENNLYSLSELTNYSVDGPDYNYGVFKDFVFNVENLELKFIVVDIGDAYLNDFKIIPIGLLEAVDWATGSVMINLKDTPNESLIPLPSKFINREEEYINKHNKSDKGERYTPFAG